MKRVGLKPHYLPLVIDGRKRSTIRAGAKRGETGPALLVAGSASLPIHITQVIVKRLGDLDEADAQFDGFDSLTELRQALALFYPDLMPDDPVSIMHFERTDSLP